MRRHRGSGWSRRALAALLPLALGWQAARAQEAATPPAEAAPWKLSVTPYLWAINFDGDVGVGRFHTDVDASFDQILHHLHGALMLDLELRKGPFAVMANTLYSRLDDDSSAFDNQLKVKTTARMLIQELNGTYRVGTWSVADLGAAGPLAVAVDPYAGLRYTYLDAQLHGKLDAPSFGIDEHRTVSGDEHWVDPVIGLRAIWTLGQRWSLIMAGDVGGTSTSKDYSLQGTAVVGYRFGLFGADDANLLAGYRVLRQKYEDGDGPSHFDWDVTLHGPVVGLTIAF